MANRDCEKTLDLINEYIDGELGAEDARFVRLHIENCPECKKAFEELKEIKNLFESSAEEAPETLYDRVMDEVRAEKPTVRNFGAIRKWGTVAIAAAICLCILSTPTLLMIMNGGAKAEAEDNGFISDLFYSDAELPNSSADRAPTEAATGGKYDVIENAEAEDRVDDIIDAIEKVESFPETLPAAIDSSEYTAHMLDGSIKRLILDTENLTAKLDGKEYNLTVSGLKYTLKSGEEITFEFNCGDFAYFRQIGN